MVQNQLLKPFFLHKKQVGIFLVLYDVPIQALLEDYSGSEN